MLKELTVFSTLGLLLILTSYFFLSNDYNFFTVKAHLPVHNIDSGIDYASIQEALDASETLDGHTIKVDAEIYYEHVVLNKAVRLVSASVNEAIIDGNGTGYVLSVKVNGVEICGFTIQNGERGINLDHVQNVSVCGNLVFNCSYRGIFVWGCSWCTVTNNTFILNKESNVELWSSHRITVSNNTVINSSHGIYLLIDSTKNVIERNTVIHNNQGIVLSYGCNNNVIKDNTIMRSSIGGITMGGAYNNTVYHNNLLKNTVQVFSYGGSINFWDNGAEGNFWDHYSGVDVDEDGIGDIPNIIDDHNKDNFPLKGAFSSFNFKCGGEIRQVTLICNSTISKFTINTLKEEIKFNVSGENETTGFCRISIPKDLMKGPYIVLVDGLSPKTLKELPISNTTHVFLHFTYVHSTRQVIIIPEFSILNFWLTIITFAMFTVFLCRYLKSKNLP